MLIKWEIAVVLQTLENSWVGTISQVSQHFINLPQFSTEEFSDQKKIVERRSLPLPFEPVSRDATGFVISHANYRQGKTERLYLLPVWPPIVKYSKTTWFFFPRRPSPFLTHCRKNILFKLLLQSKWFAKYKVLRENIFNLQIYSSLVTMKLASKNTLKIVVCMLRRPDFQFCQNSHLEKECDLQIANFWQ